jgi:hypothetical protein
MDGTTMRRFAEQDHRNGEHTDPAKNADYCWYCRDILSGERWLHRYDALERELEIPVGDEQEAGW